MNDKKYLEAVANALAEASPYVDDLNLLYTQQETERRLLALKAQEDNIKSDHWEEKKDE